MHRSIAQPTRPRDAIAEARDEVNPIAARGKGLQLAHFARQRDAAKIHRMRSDVQHVPRESIAPRRGIDGRGSSLAARSVNGWRE